MRAPLLPQGRRGRVAHAAHAGSRAQTRLCPLDAEATEAEDRLWQELRGRRLDGIKFRRQVPVPPYVVDFACMEAMLIVEVDGSQHGDDPKDGARTAFLRSRGFRVLRFWNDEVLREMNSVCDTIIAYVRDRDLQPWR